MKRGSPAFSAVSVGIPCWDSPDPAEEQGLASDPPRLFCSGGGLVVHFQVPNPPGSTGSPPPLYRRLSCVVRAPIPGEISRFFTETQDRGKSVTFVAGHGFACCECRLRNPSHLLVLLLDSTSQFPNLPCLPVFPSPFSSSGPRAFISFVFHEPLGTLSRRILSHSAAAPLDKDFQIHFPSFLGSPFGPAHSLGPLFSPRQAFP